MKKCRQVARKKVESVCRKVPMDVVEWKDEEVCAKVPHTTCNTVSKITPTKVSKSPIKHLSPILVCRFAPQRRWRSAGGW